MHAMQDTVTTEAATTTVIALPEKGEALLCIIHRHTGNSGFQSAQNLVRCLTIGSAFDFREPLRSVPTLAMRLSTEYLRRVNMVVDLKSTAMLK